MKYGHFAALSEYVHFSPLAQKNFLKKKTVRIPRKARDSKGSTIALNS